MTLKEVLQEDFKHRLFSCGRGIYEQHRKRFVTTASYETTKRKIRLTRCCEILVQSANCKRMENATAVGYLRGIPPFRLDTDIRSIVLQALTHLNSANSLKNPPVFCFSHSTRTSKAMCWYKYA